MDIIEAVRVRIPLHLAQRKAITLSLSDFDKLVDALYRIAAADGLASLGVIFQKMPPQMRAQLPPSVACLVYDATGTHGSKVEVVPLEIAHNFLGSIANESPAKVTT